MKILFELSILPPHKYTQRYCYILFQHFEQLISNNWLCNNTNTRDLTWNITSTGILLLSFIFYAISHVTIDRMIQIEAKGINLRQLLHYSCKLVNKCKFESNLHIQDMKKYMYSLNSNKSRKMRTSTNILRGRNWMWAYPFRVWKFYKRRKRFVHR